MVRAMTQQDGERVLEIFKMGIDTRKATFETTVPSWIDWDSGHYNHSRFVFEDSGNVVGWIALSPTSARKAYGGVAEVSVYIDANYRGKGIGSMLMEKVIESSEEHGIWTIYSSIFSDNAATLALHKKFNFRIIGTRERIAQLDGTWRDTILLERRSKTVGV